MTRKIVFLTLAASLACNKPTTSGPVVQTATVQRRDILVQAEATGVIEPINVIEIKSKTASGQVLAMGIEVGSYVRPGDLIVQIDTTDLHTNLLQARSDKEAAQQAYNVAKAALDRNTAFYEQRIITKDVLEQSQNQEANSRASLMRSQTSLTLAEQRLKESQVIAAVEGTILTKPVSVGQVIQAGGGTVSGGSIIATMADLRKVRARALVAETEIGQVQVGQDAVVLVDAFPERAFNGSVEKIEPQAVVQQNVTMFPVLISLDNSEGLLRPGMNGEVAVRTDERTSVLTVPNDAIRSTREWDQAARALGLNADSVRAIVMPAGGRGAGGGNGAARAGAAQAQTSRAELAPELLQGGNQAGGRQGGGEGRRGGGRGQMPEVTDAQCNAVDAAMKAKPAAAKRLEDLRGQMRNPDADRAALRTQQEAAYRELGVEMGVANACAFRAGGGRGGPGGGGREGAAAGGQAGAQGQGGQQFAGGAGMRGGRGGRGGQGGQAGAGGQRRVDPNATPRTGLVFVQKDLTWEPRVLRLGIANYDFTEVVSGVEEGEKVALMAAAILQLRRQEQMDRTRANASPLGGSMGGPGRGGPGGGGGGRGGF